MSLDYMTLAWRTELSAGPRLVLLAICDSANDDGSCYPSIQALALKSGLSVRAVRGHVAEMAVAGLLVRHERDGRSTNYQISLTSLRSAVFKSLSSRKYLSEYDRGILRSCAPDESQKTVEMATPAESAAPKTGGFTPAESAYPPGRICLPPRQNLPTPPAESAAITINEPSINQHGKKKGSSADAPTFVLPGWINRVHWDAWHSSAKRKNASDAQKQMAVEKLDGWRQQGVDHAAALENAAIAGWQGLFKPDAVAGEVAAETVYQRSMRERVEQLAPAIARKAPGAAPAMQAVDFFNSVNTASRGLHVVSDVSALRIGSQS